MPKTLEKPTGGSSSPAVSPKKCAMDPDEFGWHHPEIQQTVDEYADLVEATVDAAVDAAKADDDHGEVAYRHQFIPYCG